MKSRTKTLAKVREVIDSPWLTVIEAQKYIGMGNSNTQQEWRDSGQLPFYVIKRTILYKKSEIDKFIEKHRIGKRT